MNEWLAIVISALALAFGYLQWRENRREKDLRREEVLDWASEAIATLQTMVLLCALDERQFGGTAGERVTQAMIDASVLTERGRLFFRNVPQADDDLTKPAAYRGLRPVVLNPLILAHQIAGQWAAADIATRRTQGAILEQEAKEFVSMIRAEVGRARFVSSEAARGGGSVHLPTRLAEWQGPAAEREWL